MIVTRMDGIPVDLLSALYFIRQKSLHLLFIRSWNVTIVSDPKGRDKI